MDPRKKNNAKKEAPKEDQNQSQKAAVPAGTSGPRATTTLESPPQPSSSGSTSQKTAKSGTILGGPAANVTASSQFPKTQDQSPVIIAPSSVSTSQRASWYGMLQEGDANMTASSRRPEMQAGNVGGGVSSYNVPAGVASPETPAGPSAVPLAFNATVPSLYKPNFTQPTSAHQSGSNPGLSGNRGNQRPSSSSVPVPSPASTLMLVTPMFKSRRGSSSLANIESPAPAPSPTSTMMLVTPMFKSRRDSSSLATIESPAPAPSPTSTMMLVTPKFKSRPGSASLATIESPAFQPAQHPLPPEVQENVSGDEQPQGGDEPSTSGTDPEYVSSNPMNVNAQDLNDGYRRLVLRGMDCLNNVSRAMLDQFVFNSQYYYDAVLPQKDISAKQPGYNMSLPLDVNMYPLSIKIPEFYHYNIQWNPRSVETKTSLRTWKVAFWKKMCALATIAWKTNCNYEPTPPSYGLGAWNLGTEFYRHELIPENVLLNAKCNPLEVQCVLETRGASAFNTKMRRVTLSIEKHAETVETDMRTFLTKGCDADGYDKWIRLRQALQSIFYMYPAWVKGWIEDHRRMRLFFPTGYPTRGSAAEIVDDTVFYPHQFNILDNDLFVFRQGYRTTPRLFPGGIFVNVWTCFSPFYRPNIMMDHGIDVLLKVKLGRGHDGNPLRDVELRWLHESYMYVRVHTKLTNKLYEYHNPSVYPRRYYRIYGFSRFPCGTLSVPIYARDDMSGKLTAVKRGMESFLPFCESHYAAAIEKWPHLSFKRVDMKLLTLPAVKVHPTLDCYLPPWILEIKENDKYRMTDSNILSSSATKMRRAIYNTRGSDQLLQFLDTWIRRWVQTDVILPTFKVSVNPTPLQVTGHILPEPKRLLTLNLKSGQLQCPVVSRHCWQRGPLGNKASNAMMSMAKCAPCDDYMILHFEQTRPEETYRWIDSFLAVNVIPLHDFTAFHRRTPYVHNCRTMSGADEFLAHFDIALDNYRESVRNSSHPKIIFLFFPSKDFRFHIYDAFKYKCDVELGVTSQVVDLRLWNHLLSRGGHRTDIAMLSILLKLNKKMGGKNVVLQGPFIDEPDMPGTMIFGADVTHASSYVHHSIAAVAATTDMPPRTYAARVRIQYRNQELIQDIEAMVTDLVRTYHRNNPSVPLRRVFFFRDGVGMDQYSDLLRTEIPALFNGLNAGGAGSHAKVVYCVRTKRHHTKFRSRTEGGEIPPGTAVNELPVYPLQTSFYLCSHQHPPQGPGSVKLGACKPPLYHVVLDQLGLLLPELQTMIYHLCYLYEKSSFNLSIVPAIHYSHMACTRGRSHYGELIRRDPSILFPDQSVPWGTSYSFLSRTELDTHPDIRDSMYYL